MVVGSPIFPQELFDLIIDVICKIRNDYERTRALLNLALVSRPFRDRAHDYLFASIAITGNSKRTVSRLSSLFESDPLTATRGLASRITSFSCAFYPLHFKPLAIILSKIFHDGSRGGTRLTQCSLSLDKSPLNGYPLTLDKDFALALYDVCHRSRLASLTLQNFDFLPLNFLENTFMKHLTLDNTCLAESPPRVFFGQTFTALGHAVMLESVVHLEVRSPLLQTRNVPDPGMAGILHIRRILSMRLPRTESVSYQRPRSTLAFSRLRILAFQIIPWNEVTQEALEEITNASSSSLEELIITIHPRSTQNNSSLSLSKLPNLRKFTACESVGGTSFFRSVAIMLGEEEYCPALQTIELSFIIDIEDQAICLESMTDALNSLSCEVLDSHFQHSRFDTFRTIKLRPSIRVYYSAHQFYHEDYASIIRSYFPCLAARMDLDFSVSIVDWIT